MDHHLPASSANCAWGYFDPKRPPALTVDSGDTVVIDTVSGGPDVLPKSDFFIPPELLDVHANSVQEMPGHILTGPVAIRGAKPGQVLEVRIKDVQLRQNWGYNSIRPLAGTLPWRNPGIRALLL